MAQLQLWHVLHLGGTELEPVVALLRYDNKIIMYFVVGRRDWYQFITDENYSVV